MDNKEQRVRQVIEALQVEIDTLSRQLEAKLAEQKRYQDALDLWLSIDIGGSAPVRAAAVLAPQATAPQAQHAATRFRGRKFIDCVREILRVNSGPQSTGFIHDALVAGGFYTESTNFRSIVSNMLNEAFKDGRLVKIGERYSAMWSLPEARPASLTGLSPESN